MRNTFLRLTIFLSFIILNVNNSFALEAGTIEGTVIDSITLKGISYATIELLNNNDSTFVKGTITDISGKFILNEIAFGNYLLRISFLGYEKVIVPDIEISLSSHLFKINKIKLHPDLEQLNEVVVVGHKLSGVIKDNKTIYHINNKSAEIAQSGLELLRQIPDVNVSYFSDEVRLAGRKNILFQVNGRKVDNNFLMQLNPDLVDKIEVLNNPGVEYDLEADAVINIILKRQLEKGMSGEVRLNSSTSGKALMSKNNMNIDYYLNNIRFYVAARHKLHDYTIETLNERVITSPEASYLNQETRGDENGNSLDVNYGFDWFINKKNTFIAYNSIQPINKTNTDARTENYFANIVGEETNLGFTSISDKNYFYDYSIYYRHEFPKKSHEISFETYGSNRNNENTNNYYEHVDLDDSTSSNTQNQLVESTNKYRYLKVHYVYPISERVRLSTGYNIYSLSRDYKYNDLLSDYTDIIDYHEIRAAAYLNLSSNIKKVNIQAGIRYENSTTDITHIQDTANHYGFMSPSVTMNYESNKLGMFRLNYRKSIGRPSINQLSPAIYVNDSYSQSSGNPNLKPSIINRFELDHRIQLKKSTYINYKPYLSFIKDGIKQVSFSDSDSLEMRQYNNVSKEIEYGINVCSSLNLFKIWMIDPSFTYYSRNIKALPQYGINKDFKDNSWRMNLSSQLILPKNWILFLEYNYEAPTIDHQSKKYAYSDFVFGFNKIINKKLSIAAFTLNPWSSQYVYNKSRYTTENMAQNISNSINYDYLIFIKLAYKFKSGKTKKNENKQFEQEEYKTQSKGIFN